MVHRRYVHQQYENKFQRSPSGPMDETDVVGHIHPRSEPRRLVYIQFTIVRYTSTNHIIIIIIITDNLYCSRTALITNIVFFDFSLLHSALGFYRVNYESDNWVKLVQQLNDSHEAIHVLNRAQLIDDSFNLARAGMLEYSTALDLSTYLKYETDRIPWYTAVDCLTYVVERMRRSSYGYDYIKVRGNL